MLSDEPAYRHSSLVRAFKKILEYYNIPWYKRIFKKNPVWCKGMGICGNVTYMLNSFWDRTHPKSEKGITFPKLWEALGYGDTRYPLGAGEYHLNGSKWRGWRLKLRLKLLREALAYLEKQ